MSRRAARISIENLTTTRISADALQALLPSTKDTRSRVPASEVDALTRKKIRNTPELDEQIKVIEWRDAAKLKWPELEFLSHIPNGLYTPSHKARSEAKASGMNAGFPDLFLPVVRGGWPGLYIEMKSAEGSLTHAQKRFRDHLMGQGYKWYLCRSAKDAIDIIERYLMQPK